MQLLQSRDQSMEHASLLTALMEDAAEYPRLAVTLASGSLLSLLLQAASELAGTHDAEQVGRAVLCLLILSAGHWR